MYPLSRVLFSGTEANCKCSYADCEDHWVVGHSQNGEYQVVPLGMVDGFNMMCDMDSGWTVNSYCICMPIRLGCLISE